MSLCHVISYHVMSCRVVSYRIVSYRIIPVSEKRQLQRRGRVGRLASKAPTRGVKSSSSCRIAGSRFVSKKKALLCSQTPCGEAELWFVWVSFVLACSSRISPESHQNFTRISPRISPESHQNLTRISPECSPEFHQNSPGCH